MRRALVALGSAVILVLGSGASASAAWAAPGSGSGFAKAFVAPTGAKPTASRSGVNVTVAWTASTFGNGASVEGYVVRRYEALTDVSIPVLPNCAGTVSALSCTETLVPPGSWRYTITPVHRSWIGSEGPKSDPITVL